MNGGHDQRRVRATLASIAPGDPLCVCSRERFEVNSRQRDLPGTKNPGAVAGVASIACKRIIAEMAVNERTPCPTGAEHEAGAAEAIRAAIGTGAADAAEAVVAEGAAGAASKGAFKRFCRQRGWSGSGGCHLRG